MFRRVSPCDDPCCLRPITEGSAFGFTTFEAIWVHLRYGPVIRSPSFLDGFVNRLQDFQSPSFLLFKLRGFELLPRWDFHPLFMPAFAGRTVIGSGPLRETQCLAVPFVYVFLSRLGSQFRQLVEQFEDCAEILHPLFQFHRQ